jgi:hypothetical protein
MKVNCDLQLTLMASSLYRLLGAQIGNGYAHAKSRHIFRDFIHAVGDVTLTEREVIVRFQKRAHNPLLLAAGFAERTPRANVPATLLSSRRPSTQHNVPAMTPKSLGELLTVGIQARRASARAIGARERSDGRHAVLLRRAGPGVEPPGGRRGGFRFADFKGSSRWAAIRL